ncbi:MAG: YcgN family cysteine cluster protein [bacterium]|nr:YcgN family cysteine cluster protein [Gammaproteobacteria bacterium]HIL96850.1 YcgN family cysteine cluster protein [Pseudomonadales bacterium]
MANVFWKEKTLAEMNPQEWESLCDGCARCCLHKLEDEDTSDVFYTSVVCRYLEPESCRCSDYENRNVNVPNCVHLSIDKVDKFHWLPDTCAYRLLAESKELPWWHPLISGDRNTVAEAGITVTGKVINERYVHPDGYDEHIIHWVHQ